MGTLYKKEFLTEQHSQPSFSAVAYRQSKTKWISKFHNGPSFHVDRGIWARLTRTIFRKGRYTETVVDPATGEVLHHQSEPLADHTGHGDAKPRGGQ
jgi:hypothetical protein